MQSDWFVGYGHCQRSMGILGWVPFLFYSETSRMNFKLKWGSGRLVRDPSTEQIANRINKIMLSPNFPFRKLD